MENKEQILTYGGIDLGLNCTGIALVRNNSVMALQYERVKKKEPQIVTMEAVAKMVGEVFRNSRNFLVVGVGIEKPFLIKGRGKILLELLGIVKLTLYRIGVPFTEVAQPALKKFSTGYGHASKEDMRKALYKKVGEDNKYSEHQIDAAWLGFYAQAHQELF